MYASAKSMQDQYTIYDGLRGTLLHVCQMLALCSEAKTENRQDIYKFNLNGLAPQSGSMHLPTGKT